MYDYVPEDILEKILHRLPTKSIGRCMAVCKSWNFLIKKFILSAPDIVDQEILRRLPPRSIVNCMAVCKSWNFLIKKRISSTPPLFLMLHPRDHFSLCSPNIQCSFLSLPQDGLNFFVGALNGLICFTSHNNFKTWITLFNPLTHRVLKLPTSPMMDYTYLHLGFRFEFGFFFDSKKNDFKVISICYPEDIRVHPEVELYSFNEGAWRVINASSLMQPSINLSDPELYDYRIGHHSRQVLYHGNVHWLAFKTILYRKHEQRNPSMINYILIFNVLEEKFNKMLLPDVLANSPWRLGITVIDGCLSIIQYHTDGSCNIWMKRESWSNTQSVYLSEGKIEHLFGQNTSSEVLVLPRSSRLGETVSLHSYNLKSQGMRDLGVESTFVRICAFDFTYNLNFLDKKSNGEV